MRFRPNRLLGVLAWALLTLSLSAVEPGNFSAPIQRTLESSGFRTVGWSKAGTVCLLQALDGGARGATGVQLVLFDAVEDQTIAEVSLWSDEFDVPAEELVPAMLGSEAFGDFLARYNELKLVFSETALAPFPLTSKTGTFTAKAEVKAVGSTKDYGSRTLDYRVIVSAKGVGSKTVTSARVEMAYEVTILGQVLSPFEPRALVVYQVSQPGFEGDRNVSLRFAGCKLTSGFK